MKKGSFDLRALLEYFRVIGEENWGVILDTAKLETVFRPIKEGKEKLTVRHLDLIKEDFAFLSWWKMPEVSDSELKIVNTAFCDLVPHDEKLIWRLFDIIKNIEIVSCILRSIDPEQYAIFSPPVENLLNVRGKNQVEKYLNYIRDLEVIRDAYDFTRIADVDHALWALANIINSDKLRNMSPYNKFYQDYQRELNIIKALAAKNSLRQIWAENPLYLDVAGLFLNEDPVLAGLIASREFELIIKQLCREHRVGLKYRTERGIYWLYIPELAEKLRIKKAINHDEEAKAKKFWELRNLLVHGAELAHEKKPEISEMLSWLNEMSQKYRIEQRTTLKQRRTREES